MPHEVNENLRKALHIVFGLFALTLRWLPWWAAAGVAAAAVAGNWLVLHRIVGARVSRHARGWDAGIVIYPAAVLLLILVFRHDLHIAAVAWVALAFGDGFATLAGKSLGGPRLPWNFEKSWSGFFGFILAAYPAVMLVSYFLSDEPAWLPRWFILLVVCVAGAIAESLPLGVDDNISVPFATAVAAWTLMVGNAPRLWLDDTTAYWLIANAVLAATAYVARSVDVSGAVGGWFLGTILILCGTPGAYVGLLTFFILGTATTKLGYARKAREGLAQERGGRRGFGHAFANVGMAAILSIAMTFRGGLVLPLWLAAVAALATAAADTVASEIGQLAGRRCFLPLTFKPVPRGTEGAVSIEGTLAGVGAAAAVGLLAVLTLVMPLMTIEGARSAALWRIVWPLAGLVTIAGVIGSYVESIVGHWNRTSRLGIANGALNFFNTVVGAGVMLLMAPAVDWVQTWR